MALQVSFENIGSSFYISVDAGSLSENVCHAIAFNFAEVNLQVV